MALRTILGRIVGWIDRFKQVGNNVVQYDPVHSALPWAAVCLCLDIAMSDVQNHTAYIDGLEQVSNLTAEFAEYQNTLLGGNSNLKKQLQTAIVALYAAVLTYLAEARRYLESSIGRRIARNVAHGGTPRANELLTAIQRHQTHAARLVIAVQHEISYSKLTQIERIVKGMETIMSPPVLPLAEKRANLLRRLRASFTNDILDAALAKCQSNTAGWILGRPVYQQWADLSDSTSKLLWIHGPPGTGKTILSATIVRSLQCDHSRSVSYFFCVHEDETKRNPDAIIRSCVAQLIEQVDLAAYVVYQHLGKDLHRPLTASEVWLCFAVICKEVPNCTLIIDGFDECLSEGSQPRSFEDDAKSSFLRRLLQETSNCQAHVLLVSRDDADIRTEILDKSVANVAISRYSIQKVDQEQDIQTITRRLIDEKLKDRPQSVRDELVQSAIDKSDGMMLWIQLLAKELRPRANSKALRRMVSEMPAGIEQAYERDLARLASLSGDDKAQAIYILRWLLFSSRPMTIGEIVEALIMINVEDDADSEYPTDELPDSWSEGTISEDFVNDLFRRMLGSLVDIRSSSENEPVFSHTVHFVHFSVKEFLLGINDSHQSTSILNFANLIEENVKLASICLRYMCFDVLVDVVDSIGDIPIARYPFALYAGQYWYWHASHSKSISQELMPFIRKLLTPGMSSWSVWSTIYEAQVQKPIIIPDFHVDYACDTLKTIRGNTTDRHWFSWENCQRMQDDDAVSKTVQSASEEKSLADRRGESDPKAIYYGGLLGVLDLVKSLCAQGHSVEDCFGNLGSALHAAAHQGHKEVVAWLIEQGIDVQLTAGPFSFAIIAATAVGDEAMVEWLLDRGADVNCQDGSGNAAIHYAAKCAHSGILRTLIHRGAHLNMTNDYGVTALFLAAGSAHTDAVRILLEAGADVNAIADGDLFMGTALHIATMYGLEDVTMLLLEKGADVHQASYFGATSLHFASFTGTMKILDAILDTDVELQQKDHGGLTALHYAAFANNVQAGMRLVDKGIDINAASTDGTTALLLATTLKSETLMVKLLGNGADPNRTLHAGFGPLLVAVRNGTCAMVQLLIDHGADVSKPYQNWSPVQYAVWDGRKEIVKTVIKGGADVDWRATPEENTCLALACSREVNSVEIARLLLETGAAKKVEVPNRGYIRAFCNVIEASSDVQLVQLLLDHGLDPFSKDPSWVRSPLDCAIKLKHQDALRVLILHRSVCLKLLPQLVDDVDGAVSILEALLTRDIEVFRAAIQSTQKSNDGSLLNQLFIVAVMTGVADATAYLLKKGVSVAYADRQNRMAIHYAAIRGDEVLSRQLIDLGSVVDCIDSFSCSPLQYAIQHGLQGVSTAEVLVRKEAETDHHSKIACNPNLIQYWRDEVHCLQGEIIYRRTGNKYPVRPMEIEAWPEIQEDDILNKLPRFVGHRIDDEIPITMFGFLHGEDRVSWVSLGPTYGWYYHGRVDFAKRQITTEPVHDVTGARFTFTLELSYETRMQRKTRLLAVE